MERKAQLANIYHARQLYVYLKAALIENIEMSRKRWDSLNWTGA
jgi:hypothetical protein